MRIRVVCCAVALISAVGCKDSKLADDLEWMNNTYNTHESTFGHGVSGWYAHLDGKQVLSRQTSDRFKNDGCKFEIDIKENPSAINNDVISSFRYVVNLGDIDPETVKVKTYTHFGGFGCESLSSEELESMGTSCDWAEMEAVTRKCTSCC